MQSSLLTPELSKEAPPAGTLLLWAPVFLALGIGLYFALPSEPETWAVRGGVLGAFSLAGMTWRWRGTIWWRWAAVFLVAAMLGMFLAQVRTQSIGTKLLTYQSWNKTVSGKIVETERAGAGWRIVVEDKPYRVRLTLRTKGVVPHVGDRITAKASLLPPSPPLIPGMYDFQRHAYFQGLSGYGYITKVIELQKAKTQEQNALERYREYLGERVYAVLKQPEAGVTTALLNGQRGGIARKTTENLQASGLQHVISISGLHIGLMAGLVFFVIRLLMACVPILALKYPIKKIAAVIAMVSIWIYMMIVGSDPATLRSVIMTSIVLVAIMVDREAINLRIVAIAALILLLLEPENLLKIGFQLSFMAVAALVWFYQSTREFWQRNFWNDNIIMKTARVLVMTVATTMIATISTAPLVFTHFHQIPLLSVLANVLATPAVTFVIMPGTFLIYLLSPMTFLVKFMGWGVGLMLDISDFVAGLPLAVWRLPAMPMASVVIFVAGLLVVMIVKGRERYVGYILMLAVAASISFQRPPDLFLAHGRILAMPDRKTGVLFIEGRTDHFTRNLLLKATGTRRIAAFAGSDDIQVERKNGKIIRILRTVPSLEMACDDKADVIITRYYLDRPCPDTTVIDRHFLEGRGGVAISLGNMGVSTVYAGESRRPWQQQSGRLEWSYGR